MKRITIAIDGFSSCGKSTMAKALAKKIGYIYIDSGAMYRAVTLFALENGMIYGNDIDIAALENSIGEIKISFSEDNKTGNNITELNGRNVEQTIRTMEVSSHVSAIAALPFVRESLTLQQRRMGKEKGIVMDGRDIGTTVFPDAELKIFVTASAEVRARRRYNRGGFNSRECKAPRLYRNPPRGLSARTIPRSRSAGQFKSHHRATGRMANGTIP